MIHKFTVQMYLTGLWTTQLLSLGKGRLSDAAHFLGAGVYMVDHIVIMHLMNMKVKYRRVFYRAFLTMIGSIVATQAIEKHAGLPMESDAKVATGDRVRMIKMLSPRTRRYLFLSELFLMITENLLFTSFVQGIPSGVSATKTN